MPVVIRTILCYTDRTAWCRPLFPTSFQHVEDRHNALPPAPNTYLGSLSVMHKDQLAPGSATHILVVEDDDAVGDMLTMLLEGEGYDVTLVQTAQAALHMLLPVAIQSGTLPPTSVTAAPRPAMVLLDLHLPDMSGEELIEHIAIHDIPPIIVLSAKPDQALEAANAMQHVRRVLAKPFPVDDLLDQISSVLA